jgi:hypothetical protein
MPELDLGTQAVSLTKDPLGGELVVAEARDARFGFQLGEPAPPGV